MDAQLRLILDRVGRLSQPASSLAATADLYGAGLSSLATVDVMLAIEDEFGVEFPDRLLTRRTFQSISSLDAAVGELRSRAIA